MTDATPTVSRPRPPMRLQRKLIQLAILILASMVPSLLILQLIDERGDRQGQVEVQIAKAWGPSQRIQGPVLLVPVSRSDRQPGYLAIAPRTVAANGTLAPSERRRGQFGAIVYEADLTITGVFDIPSGDLARKASETGGDALLWDEAILVMSLSKASGLRPEDGVAIAGGKTAWRSCADAALPLLTCGREALIVARVDRSNLREGERLPFTATLRVRGTEALSLTTAAAQTQVTLTSPWPDPSFLGDALPSRTEIGSKGFTATWQIDDAASAPVSVTSRGATGSVFGNGAEVGVGLIEAVSLYRMITRVAKYGLLPVCLAFALYLGFEILGRIRIHLVQYLLVAASMVAFSLMLLSLSEWIGYGPAFLLSAGLVVGQSSLYTAAVSRNGRVTITFALLMSGLFGMLFVMLGLETYALLLGTAAVFLVVSAAMAVSLRLDLTGEPDAV